MKAHGQELTAVAERLGAPRADTPEEALQELLDRSAGHCDFYLRQANEAADPLAQEAAWSLYTQERVLRMKVANEMLSHDLGGLRKKAASLVQALLLDVTAEIVTAVGHELKLGQDDRRLVEQVVFERIRTFVNERLTREQDS